MQLDWKTIQRHLKRLGLYRASVDGIHGNETQSAVITFQQNAGLTRDGVVGPVTISALMGVHTTRDHSIATAADLMELAYSVKKKGMASVNQQLAGRNLAIVAECPVKGVEAYMLNNRCLLVPGSNSVWDYAKFNFRLLNIGMPRLKFAASSGAPRSDDGETVEEQGIRWHQGFFTHAHHVQKWIGSDRVWWPRLIVGHSLGAASAQILSTIWLAPSIGFAAPRIRNSSAPVRYQNLSLSICRVDDPVCGFPRNFERLGETRDLRHARPKWGLNHNMRKYKEAMNNPAPGVSLPTEWHQPG